MLKRCAVALLLAVPPVSVAQRAIEPLTHIVKQQAVHIDRVAPDTYLLDFGRVAFGNLAVVPTSSQSQPFTVRFGEAMRAGRIDRQPPGSVRYAEVQVAPNGQAALTVAPPADTRNTTAPAVLTPAAYGVLTPFRWVEVQGWSGDLRPEQVQRNAVFDRTWNDNASSFHSSDPMLDKIWDLSFYSIKATTFAGVFVDGDRERIAYEADAYLNQLGYYAGDADPRMPRATFERLLQYPTWPSEWTPHMVFIAYADWMETGDREWLASHYEALKTRLLNDRVGPDGLVRSTPAQRHKGDIVDWPQGERDGYVFTPVNTVVNAFRLRALERMSQLAAALGKRGEANNFAAQRSTALAAFQSKLFDPAQHRYRDGTGTDHTSWHANLFPLAFNLVPAADRVSIAAWLAQRGMVGSVYAAQYLLDGLFENGQSTAALQLITAAGDRSWRHMVESGTTITWEAWDQKYKPNQDWTHAWGAAPANLLPRFVLGVEPAEPGWRVASIQPHPGSLQHAEGTLPTPLGEVGVRWVRGATFRLTVSLPPGMTAQVKLPALAGTTGIRQGSRTLAAQRDGAWWVLASPIRGRVTLEER